MVHAVGDSIWMATTFVEFDGRTRSHVTRAAVAAVIDGRIMLRLPSGTIRSVAAAGETVCDSESEAWAAVARELSEARDRVQAAIDEATARAAAGRVGEAVPA